MANVIADAVCYRRGYDVTPRLLGRPVAELPSEFLASGKPVAALGGSLATASSIIESKDGTMLYEAPHGTAHDLYLRYQESDGKEAHFNSSALIYALANALETMAVRERNEALNEYSGKLKAALINTVAQGTVTGDLKGKTSDPRSETIVDMNGFLDAVERNIAG